VSLENTYRKIGELVNQKCVDQFALQGHKMTGAFEESIELLTDDKGVSCIGNTYGIYVNVGVKPSEIKHPFARARIEGLTRFVEYRMGLSGKEAVSVAYAIATTHKREGMPTSGSYAYSDNGKRTDFIDDAIALSEEKIIDILFTEFVSVIDVHNKITGR